MVGSEFLAGNIHVFANQINENAKALAAYFLLPELNHHLLEGLTFPKTNQKLLCFFFLTSPLYDKRNQARVEVTQKVLVKKKIDFTVYPVSSPDKLSAAVEVLVLGSYVSFYLAILYGVNPSLIPWVDYFKAELKKVS
jgi:glucose/mannose-6-phosphate isomerase